jgi:hypothetical protein
MLTQVSFNENPENSERNPEALRFARFGPEVEVSPAAHTLYWMITESNKLHA